MKKAKLLLFLVMILAVVSMVLFACDHDCKDEDDDEFCDICNEYIGCLSFTKNQDNTYSVDHFDRSRTDVIIPSTYNGLPVTSIGDNAFYERRSLTSIVIPSSVTSIGEHAFDGCT